MALRLSYNVIFPTKSAYIISSKTFRIMKHVGYSKGRKRNGKPAWILDFVI